MRLSTFNPISLAFGPVFQKEVRAAGRRKSTYVFRSLYAAGLLLLVGVSFWGIRSSADQLGGVARLQALQRLAPTLAVTIIWFQFIGLALTAPILAGPAVCDEKRARTLGTLLTTPLTAGQIIGGKLTSRIVQLMILALLAAPLLLAIRVFGGLAADVILASTVLSLSTALLAAALGLMYSTWHKRATSAAVFALLTLVLLLAAPSVIEGILYYVLNSGEAGVVQAGKEHYPYHQKVWTTCAPVTLVFVVISAVSGGELPTLTLDLGPTSVNVGPVWLVNSVYNIALALGVTAFATVALRRAMRREGASEGSFVASAVTPAPRAAPPVAPGGEPVPDAAEAPVLAPASAPGRDSRVVSDHPVLWREVRQATFGSRRRFAAIAVLSILGLAYLYYEWGINDESVHMTLAILGALAIMIQPVFMTTGGIAGEREARTWEVLLTTPLRGTSILLGKAAGALRSQWFLPVVVLSHFLLAAFGGFVAPLLPVQLVAIYLGPMLFFTATGQLFSLTFRRGVTAAACNLGLAIALWALSWIGVQILQWFSDLSDHVWFDRALDVCYCLNPVAMAGSAADGGARWGRGSVGSAGAVYHIYGGGDATLSGHGFTLVVAAVLGFYALGAAFALGIGLLAFRRLSGRSS